MPRKKKKPAEQYDSYPIKILSWAPTCSVGLNKERRFGHGHYSEHHAIKIRGQLLGPEKVAAREIEVTILADRWMQQAMISDEVYSKDPRGVGSITCRGKYSEFLGAIPIDIFLSVLAMLAAGKYNYLILHGKALRYGSASIEHLWFKEDFDPEDW